MSKKKKLRPNVQCIDVPGGWRVCGPMESEQGVCLIAQRDGPEIISIAITIESYGQGVKRLACIAGAIDAVEAIDRAGKIAADVDRMDPEA